MADPADNRVAVYIDFDNIVISRYNQLFGARQFTTDRARNRDANGTDTASTRIREATVDVSAVLDYASSFGTIVVSRAYADWSAAVNAGYRDQLVDRAVDLVQLFPTVQSMKNGADIRLAVDVVEDLFRLDDLTHIVIVAGDSDYIALAQRCKRLGKYVVGIGVAGSTSRSLAAACDEFADYDALPGIEEVSRGVRVRRTDAASRAASTAPVAAAEPAPDDAAPKLIPPTPAPVESSAADAASDADGGSSDESSPDESSPNDSAPDGAGSGGRGKKVDPQAAATSLLLRAMQLVQAKNDTDWLATGGVKSQMTRMEPSFQESALGHKNFSAFIRSRSDVVEFDNAGPNESPRIRLKPERKTAPKKAAPRRAKSG